MSVVIICVHDRIDAQYKKIFKNYNCKAKVFTQMPAGMKNQIGNPDLMVLFTNTVSHKMVRCALAEAGDAEIIRCHSSSGSALNDILAEAIGKAS